MILFIKPLYVDACKDPFNKPFWAPYLLSQAPRSSKCPSRVGFRARVHGVDAEQRPKSKSPQARNREHLGFRV